jgi:hypothetical protein
MLGRALSLATVTLLTGWFAASPVWAQTQNLEAGKSPSQIFAGTCNACHKSPRGLLKTVSPGSLPGFLRQHYTTSGDMASLLSSYLVSNGASDTRLGGSQAKPSTEPKPEARSGAGPDQPDRQGRRMRPGPQEAAKPDADGSAQGEPVRQGRKRLARPVEGSDETKPAVDGQGLPQAGDDRKLSAKQRLSKRGKPGNPGGEESPKTDAAKPDTAKTDESPKNEPKAEPAKDDKPKSETAREESGKPEGTKPAGEGKPEAAKSEPAKSEPAKSEPAKSEAAKVEALKDNSGAAPVLRADPVPPVTPAPPASAAPSAAVSSAVPVQPAAPRPSAPAPSSEPPAVTASAPPPAPAGNAGPPVPPISQ